MGGLNLEVFKFGMYVMFPIGIMYYFGTNLDERFAVPGFWPKPENMNKVPTDRDEIHAELQRLRAKRLYLRDRNWDREERRARTENDVEGLERLEELKRVARETGEAAREARGEVGAQQQQTQTQQQGNKKGGWWGLW